jgi:hypothetical protein
LECGGRGERYGGSLFEGEGRGLVRELVFGGCGALGESSSAGTEDLVADGEPGHLRADRDDCPCDGASGYAVLGSTKTEAHDAHQVGLAGHLVPGSTVEAGSVHVDEHFVWLDLGAPMSVICQVSLEP